MNQLNLMIGGGFLKPFRHESVTTYTTNGGGTITVTDYLEDMRDANGVTHHRRPIDRTLTFSGMTDEMAMRFAAAIKAKDWLSFVDLLEEEQGEA